MRQPAVLVCAVLVIAIGCSSTGDTAGTAATSEPTTTRPVTTTTVPTSLGVDMTPQEATAGTADPNATGTILMIKLPVGDVEAAEKFYATLFGATPAAAMGGGIKIVTFPGGGPGLVLLGRDSNLPDSDGHGAFIIKVPNLEATKTLALVNGATEQGTFAGTPNGQAAKSIDLLDPWGNQIEILQLG